MELCWAHPTLPLAVPLGRAATPLGPGMPQRLGPDMWAARLGRASSTACALPPGAPPAEGCPTCSATLPRHAWSPQSPAQPRAQGLELPGFCEMSSGSPSSANGDSRARCSLTAGMHPLSATYGRAPSFSAPPIPCLTPPLTGHHVRAQGPAWQAGTPVFPPHTDRFSPHPDSWGA